MRMKVTDCQFECLNCLLKLSNEYTRICAQRGNDTVKKGKKCCNSKMQK